MASSCHIGYLPDRSSRKTAEGVAELYLQERGELLKKIDSYLGNRKMQCHIVVPTCLRTPVLILDPKECMHRYHNPELQGAFPTQFPVDGFGFVQPHNDLRRSIIPPNFCELLARVAAAMTTLIREDILAAEVADTEHHAPLRGLPPLLSCPHVTSTTMPRRARHQSEGAESSDTENARRMEDLSMEEAKCSLVRELLSCQGHSHLRCPPDKHAIRSPVKDLLEGRADKTPPCRSVSVADLSVADAKRDLASSWTHLPAPILPLMSLLAHPASLCSRLGTDVGQLTGCQLDANRQSHRDMAKRVSSPAQQEHNKKARNPSTEEGEEETDEMVWHSQEQRQRRECSRARSKSQNRRRHRAKSQARTQVAEATSAKGSFIPAGYENTRREELQREARREKEQVRKDKAQERQQ